MKFHHCNGLIFVVDEKVEGNEHSSMDDYITAFYEAVERMGYSYPKQHLYTT